MRRIGLLTAGGDTPALNATIFGAVERANQLKIELVGITRGFAGMLDPALPHVRLNPLYSTIPELNPNMGGTLLGASRTYIDPDQPGVVSEVKSRLQKLGVEGLICVGGDGTLNGMQPLVDSFPCVLAPKTIDNDLGLNYLEEPTEVTAEESARGGKRSPDRPPGRDTIELDDIVNYATPGYATAVFVVVQGIERIRTTAESHRRIAIIEVMGRESGFIALGSAYGQPDIILVPEVPLDMERLEKRVAQLYELQKHAVIVIGEGICDQAGRRLGDASKSHDPAGNVIFSGAADELKRMLCNRFGNDYFGPHRTHEAADSAIFTRKVGHTQRGGFPIKFDRFYAAQLGAKAVELIAEGRNNVMATLQYAKESGFSLGTVSGNKLRDPAGRIHPRRLHPCFYDSQRFQPSHIGKDYLRAILTNALGAEDVEHMRSTMFCSGKLATRYQSVCIDIQRRIEVL